MLLLLRLTLLWYWRRVAERPNNHIWGDACKKPPNGGTEVNDWDKHGVYYNGEEIFLLQKYAGPVMELWVMKNGLKFDSNCGKLIVFLHHRNYGEIYQMWGTGRLNKLWCVGLNWENRVIELQRYIEINVCSFIYSQIFALNKTSKYPFMNIK